MDMSTACVSKLLLRLSPPVMLALLIQSVYNIVDSFFIARYMPEGLTALSIIYPIQLLMTALATGTGAGVNLLIAGMDGQGEKKQQQTVVMSGLALGAVHFLLFAVLGSLLAGPYFRLSSENETVCALGIAYTQIVFGGSFGLFVESICTKVLQEVGKMGSSVFIIVLQQIFLLVPLAWLLHFAGLRAVWWTFPLTELIASLVCFAFERRLGQNPVGTPAVSNLPAAEK